MNLGWLDHQDFRSAKIKKLENIKYLILIKGDKKYEYCR